ncbi:MAG: pyridine nucleotide-disulfide oxidoreductase [Deltaproteobacteria bacterium]|nr:MAG: pyridine nucleotide-disulfide oxidoreductase [Deltaproteobacteria bacterium]
MGKRIVVIGAVAAGPKAAARVKRLDLDAQVIMVDQAELISYGGCGLPYYISGEVSDINELMSTSFHLKRDAKFFEGAKGVEVRTRTRALAIDRAQKSVRLQNLATEELYSLDYDQLVLATGSTPIRLPIPGAELPGVFTVANPSDAEAIREPVSKGEVEQVVIIGGGAIGLELAEAFTELWGLETAVVELQEHLLPGLLDSPLARMVQAHVEAQGVKVYCGEQVQQLEAENGRVARVVTSKRTLPADLVIMAVGVRPNSQLAREAGLLVGPTGGIVVNQRLQTSDPLIYAGGDCIENYHLLTGKRVHYPSGSIANRQGRVIGTNLNGGHEIFEGVIGSYIMKLFELSVGCTGLSLAAAQREGFDAFETLVSQADQAHFYPGQELMYLQLVADRPTQRLLGLQGVGAMGQGVKARIDAVGAMLKFKPTLDDLSNLEVAYAPPFAAALDIVNAAANTAKNILAGTNHPLPMDDFISIWKDKYAAGVTFLDIRERDNAAPLVEKWGPLWVNIPQGELRYRLAEVPQDKKLILVCNAGMRSYESQVILDHAGITGTANLQGGYAALKKAGIDLLADD